LIPCPVGLILPWRERKAVYQWLRKKTDKRTTGRFSRGDNSYVVPRTPYQYTCRLGSHSPATAPHNTVRSAEIPVHSLFCNRFCRNASWKTRPQNADSGPPNPSICPLKLGSFSETNPIANAAAKYISCFQKAGYIIKTSKTNWVRLVETYRGPFWFHCGPYVSDPLCQRTAPTIPVTSVSV
jgi:hypothetical protein